MPKTQKIQKRTVARKITNRSVFWSEEHEALLVFLANKVNSRFGFLFDPRELVNVGYFAQARYYKKLKNKSPGIKREMTKWAARELEKGRFTSICKIDEMSVVRKF